MIAVGPALTLGRVPRFLLHHQHRASECAAAFASWAGVDSPLRRERVASSCLTGGHGLWWIVDAADVRAALALLPPFVASRTTVIGVRDVRVP